MADQILPIIHRGIAIRQAEVPGAPYEWTHEETDAHDMALTLADAKRQINTHLGGDNPDCEICRGTGAEDWSHLAYIPCPLCRPEEDRHAG